jgi:mannose/cellobiose epimerase-like protein (N-acyl-D-glucosamine 2-epimerase family)
MAGEVPSEKKASAILDQYFNQSMSLLGKVVRINSTDPSRVSFHLRPRLGGTIEVHLGETTSYQPLMNLDRINRDRYRDSPRDEPDAVKKLKELKEQAEKAGYTVEIALRATPALLATRYLEEGNLVAVQGIYQRHGGAERFEARTIFLLQQAPIDRPAATPMSQEMKPGGDERRFYFENTYWWINQIQRLTDQWLDDLFDARRNYQISDFAEFYRTNLNIVGLPTDDNVQEMAMLSRLIYGLSSAYLLTGIDRYRLAANAGVAYQREAFRGSSADGRFTFWSAAKRRMKYGSQYVMTSQNPDDKDTIPMYEQIYALAGLAQYYRITADREVLEDLRRTATMIRQFFRDEEQGGYFSHLDYVTLQPADPSLGSNQSRKNWNSIGDHIPAYLINLILSLDPLPRGRDDLAGFREDCLDILRETTALICKHFPEQGCHYVQERFYEDWKPDREWGWQQNRGIVGHNLKIAWHLTRAANYFLTVGENDRAKSCMEVADKLAETMADFGLDALRGGCFDAVERVPQNGMPIEFTWGTTKDFWQQEQGILAYLIPHGNTTQDASRGLYLELAREMMAFWNIYFLDRENQGIFFRVTENGLPVVLDGYANKASHSIAGYHAFELNFLAHIYLRSFVERPKPAHQRFTLYFHPAADSQAESINVLPDFFRPGTMTLSAVMVNGRRVEFKDRADFQVKLRPEDLGSSVVAEFQPVMQPERAK